MRTHRLLSLLLLGVVAILASYFWFSTLDQPLIDAYEFRQTQTALTALFMQPGLDGILNYQTPVLGAPWSIPFEFPLFQWLAAQLAKSSGLDLSTSGRLISVLFGVGCLWPAIGLMRRFGMAFTGLFIFVLLYLASSIYLYWNRSFLMESMALFFTLVSLNCYSQLRRASNQPKAVTYFTLVAVFGLSLSFGLLVKATTALPALILMGFDWIWQNKNALQSKHGIRNQLLIGCAMLIGFFLLYFWTHHADSLKQLNPVGARLTSKALRGWNFGQISQRWDPALWEGVVAKRMLTPISTIPILVLLVAGIWKSSNNAKVFIFACLYLAISPLLMFTNLHIVHSYYQTSNQIFLLMAIAGAADTIISRTNRKPSATLLVVAVLAIMLSSDYSTFKRDYLPVALMNDSEKLSIGKMIEANTRPDSAIIVFGDEWSSAFAYHSKRRAFTLPDWMPGISASQVLSIPGKFLGDYSLGAIVSKDVIGDDELPPGCNALKESSITSWHLYICVGDALPASQLEPVS
jgi:hypothetical protein